VVLSLNPARKGSSENQGGSRLYAEAIPGFFRLFTTHTSGGGACPEPGEGTGSGVDLIQLSETTLI
jgi:hypothetical protein